MQTGPTSLSPNQHQDFSVELLGWFENTEAIYVAMEYVPLRTLDGYVPSVIDEDGARQIFKAVVSGGLERMREAGYVHRDVKPAVGHLQI